MKNHRHIATLMLLLLLSCLLPGLTQTGAVSASDLPYKDPSLPIEKRVADLLSRMTLEEKVSQMMNAAPASTGSTFRNTNGGTRDCTVSHAPATQPFSRKPSGSRPCGTPSSCTGLPM